MHVAPPKHRLDSMYGRHSRMVSKKLSQLCVHAALYRVIGRFPYTSELFLQLHEREHHPLLRQTVQNVPRLAKTLVGVLAMLVPRGELAQEAFPFGALFGMLGEPCGSRGCILRLQEPSGDGIELPPAIELGAGGRAPLHRLEHMEEASLDARGRPDSACRLGKAGRAVGYRHDGSGDAKHEGRPGLRSLALRQMPCEYMPTRARYEHDDAARDPDAIQEDDVTDLAGIRGDWPYPPELAHASSESAPFARHVLLDVFREEPFEEL